MEGRRGYTTMRSTGRVTYTPSESGQYQRALKIPTVFVQYWFKIKSINI
jgi:hypothetical protein